MTYKVHTLDAIVKRARDAVEALSLGKAGELVQPPALIRIISDLSRSILNRDSEVRADIKTLMQGQSFLEKSLKTILEDKVAWLPLENFSHEIEPFEHVLLSDGFNMEVGYFDTSATIREARFLDTSAEPLGFNPTHFKKEVLPDIKLF